MKVWWSEVNLMVVSLTSIEKSISYLLSIKKKYRKYPFNTVYRVIDLNLSLVTVINP